MKTSLDRAIDFLNELRVQSPKFVFKNIGPEDFYAECYFFSAELNESINFDIYSSYPVKADVCILIRGAGPSLLMVFYDIIKKNGFTVKNQRCRITR